MALIGTINIAMTASTQALQKSLQKAQGVLGSFGSIATGIFHGAVGTAFMHGMKLAEEFRENVEKLDFAFGDSSDSIVEGADKMAEAFGVSRVAYTSMASSLGGSFKAKGVDEESAAAMTNQLLVLGQAVANFKHIGLDEAIGKIKAGLAGRGRGLAEFGIGLNDSAIKSEALAMGLVKVGEKLTPAAKAQAAFNIMMREGSGLIDQMGERANDRSNAFKEFWGRLENIQEMFAEKLPAPVESFFAQLNVGVVAAMTAWTDWSNEVITGQNDLMEFGQNGGQSIGFVQKAVGYLADAWQLLTAGFKLMQIGFNASLLAMVKGVQWIGKQIDWLFEKLGMETNTGAGDFLEAFGDNLHDTLSTEVDQLKADWAKPWSHEGINASFDAARKKLHEARAEVANAAKASFVPVAGKAAAAASKGNPFAEAMGAGSREAASTILRSKFGVGSDKDMAKVASNTEKMTGLLESINDHLENVSDNAGEMDVLGAL